MIVAHNLNRRSGACVARTTMCNCTSENLEIPRCAIAHLRSGPSDHPGMTGFVGERTFTRRGRQVLSQSISLTIVATITAWKRLNEFTISKDLSRLPRCVVGRVGVEEDASADA